MKDDIPPGARTSPSSARNRDPILRVLETRLPPAAQVLEVASGAGEHAVHVASALPGVRWLPSDREDLVSISAWRAHAALANIEPPTILDACDPGTWPTGPFDALVCINMIHIAPWSACQGLMALAARVLTPTGRLILYGPFLEADLTTAPGNLAFDDSLKRRDPAWGIRDLADVAIEAGRNGLALAERVAMPANNLMVIFARR